MWWFVAGFFTAAIIAIPSGLWAVTKALPKWPI
jgi:hypothetical protein